MHAWPAAPTYPTHAVSTILTLAPTLQLTDFAHLQVWAVVPTNLVEAERKGAKLVQSLAEADSPSNGTKDLVLSDTTNNGQKRTNGHKEAGM